MKKALLFLAAVILTGALVIGCSQPVTSMDVIQTAPSAPEVNSELIKTEAFDGFILVTWGAGEETSGYTVYRQEIYTADGDDWSKGDVIEGTLSQLGSGSASGIKKIPYYVDSSIKNGAQYQYGIVNWGYQQSGTESKPVSGIVWQEFDDDKPLATAKGKNETGFKVDRTGELAFPTIIGAVKKIDTKQYVSPNYPEELQYTLTGFKSGFSYSFQLQRRVTTAGVYNGWSSSDSDVVNFYSQSSRISNYLDTGKWEETITFSSLPTSDGSSLPADTIYRMLVTVTADGDGYIVNKQTGSSYDVLNTNQQVASWFASGDLSF